MDHDELRSVSEETKPLLNEPLQEAANIIFECNFCGNDISVQEDYMILLHRYQCSLCGCGAEGNTLRRYRMLIDDKKRAWDCSCIESIEFDRGEKLTELVVCNITIVMSHDSVTELISLIDHWYPVINITRVNQVIEEKILQQKSYCVTSDMLSKAPTYKWGKSQLHRLKEAILDCHVKHALIKSAK